MIFCTPWFLLFTVVTAVASLLVLPWPPARLILMLAASIVFYLHFAGISGFAVIATLALYTYLAGHWLHQTRSGESPPSTLRLLGCLAPAVGALVYYRYTGFCTDTLRLGLGLPTVPDWVQAIQPAVVPLGISFFAFEFCHYLVDVSHGATPIRSPLHFSLFALFYPRLASGPIVRFQQIVPQLAALPKPTQDDVAYGLLRLTSGFAKKFLLADPAAHLVATAFHANNILVGSDVLWLCLLLYVRIYCDFGGYCDMAIGLARFWGLRLPENFHFPFLATSPSTFWQRWHITLSTWIRDYIYIPLGGGRVATWRKALNLLCAMALCGLWHGAAWNFVLWGLLHGLALQVGHGISAGRHLLAGRLAAPAWLRLAGSGLAISLGWALTQTFVALAWIPFFYSAEDAWKIIRVLGHLP